MGGSSLLEVLGGFVGYTVLHRFLFSGIGDDVVVCPKDETASVSGIFGDGFWAEKGKGGAYGIRRKKGRVRSLLTDPLF